MDLCIQLLIILNMSRVKEPIEGNFERPKFLKMIIYVIELKMSMLSDNGLKSYK